MDIGRFWFLVEGTSPSAGEDLEAFEESLTDALATLTVEEVIAFHGVWAALELRAFTWDLWAAAWVLGQGGSDDAFLGFRGVLIALGRAPYERALEDPETLAGLDVRWDLGDEDDIWVPTATLDAYERLTGRDADMEVLAEQREPQEPSGGRWDLRTVAERVPRLAAKVGYDPAKVRLLEPCPCCGSLTIEDPGEYDICPVCWWEDDGDDRDSPAEISGPNGLSLNDARANYARIGACDERARDVARPPRPFEVPPAG